MIESLDIVLKNFWQFYTESRQVCGLTIPEGAGRLEDPEGSTSIITGRWFLCVWCFLCVRKLIPKFQKLIPVIISHLNQSSLSYGEKQSEMVWTPQPVVVNHPLGTSLNDPWHHLGPGLCSMESSWPPIFPSMAAACCVWCFNGASGPWIAEVIKWQCIYRQNMVKWWLKQWNPICSTYDMYIILSNTQHLQQSPLNVGKDTMEQQWNQSILGNSAVCLCSPARCELLLPILHIFILRISWNRGPQNPWDPWCWYRW